jgi:hypothetical protein
MDPCWLFLVFLSSLSHFFFKLVLLIVVSGGQCFLEGFLFLCIQAMQLFFDSGQEVGMISDEVSPLYGENGSNSRNLMGTDHKISNI